MTKRMPAIERACDNDGRAIVLVPLANYPVPAKLFEADFDALRAAGLTDHWTFNNTGNGHAYVRAGHYSSPGKLITVARVIEGAGPRVAVKYADGNPLNLRRDNLYLGRGNAAKSFPAITIRQPLHLRPVPPCHNFAH